MPGLYLINSACCLARDSNDDFTSLFPSDEQSNITDVAGSPEDWEDFWPLRYGTWDATGMLLLSTWMAVSVVVGK